MSEPVTKTEDDWQREATAWAVASAQRVVASGAINKQTRVATLGNIELGWIGFAFLAGWIEVKARQAVEEGKDAEITIRTIISHDPAPWVAGAVATILPKLAEIEGLDWDKPVGEWSRDQIIKFIWESHQMTDAALAARDAGAVDKIVRHLEKAERENSAANGGSLMTHEELNQEIPF